MAPAPSGGETPPGWGRLDGTPPPEVRRTVPPPPPPGGEGPGDGAGDDQPARKSRRGLVLGLVGGGVLLAAAYVAVAMYAGDRVPRGTEVAGVAIGGLDPAAAEERLTKDLGRRAKTPMTIVVDGKQRDLNPVEAGLALDAKGTVDEVHGRFSLNPMRVYHVIFGANEVDPVVSVDDAKLDKAIGGLATKVDRKPVEGAVTFADGKAEAKQPKTGLRLDRAKTSQRISSAYLVESAPVELPVSTQQPKVKGSEIDRAVQEFGEPAMSGPVTVKAGADESFQITPKDLGKALSMKADAGGKLQPKLDAKKLTKAVDDELDEIGTKPKDATIRLEGGTPTVVPSKDGMVVQPAQLSKAVLGVLTKSGSERVATVKPTRKAPDLTTAKVKKLGVKEVVGEFTTTYPHADYRNTNIGRGAELIDGTFLEPGETFSLNDTVGERTEANGFSEGYVIEGGRLRKDLGGGVSQLATTVFNAGHFGGMEDVEHRAHAFYIDRYPVGREATVYWGSIDLRFKNPTPYGVLVDAKVDRSSPGNKGSVTVRLWSTKYYEVDSHTGERYNFRAPATIVDDKSGCVEQPGSSGFDIDVTRTLSRNGKVVKKETDTTKYRAEDKITCKAGSD